MAKPAALFVMGPTATGKTDLAVALHSRLPVEIISVDSALVYRGMDIGTAKPDAALRARVPHHLIDIRDPAEPYSAADFLRDAAALMAAITARDRIPLLVGGTMLYFRVLLEGLSNLPPPDGPVREWILREAERFGWPEMHRRLARVDPDSAAAIHPNHSQRIQRALEIHRITGKPASRLRAEQGLRGVAGDYDIVQIGLLPRDRALLHRRIAQRFAVMLELGLIDEVRGLYDRGDLHRDLPAIRSVGYRQVWDYLAGELGEGELEGRAVAATRQLAKRQLTWLRGWPDLNPVFIDDGGGAVLPADEVLKCALKFIEPCPIY